MSEYQEGDLIEAVKGESVVRGRLHQGTQPYSKQYRYVGDFADVDYYIRQGFTVTVLEKAAPPLPTEPGHYLDKDGHHWELPSVGELDPYWAPYTRLEPVPVTVQKVIDYLVSECANGWLIEGVRKHFGVS